MSPFTYGYIVGSAIIAGFAAYYDFIFMMLTAFLFMCGSRIYEERFDAKWARVWRSVIEKYEAAAIGGPDASVDELQQEP